MLAEFVDVCVNDWSIVSFELSRRQAGEEVTQVEAPTIIVDVERADRVLGMLLELYHTSQYPYNLPSTRVPHHPEHMPKTMPRGDVEHASFHWAACYYMRGGIKSVEAYKRLSKVYDSDIGLELFDFTKAQHLDPSLVADSLQEAGLGFRNTISRHWVENARRMSERYGGDPRNIFDDMRDYDEALRRISNDGRGGGFLGFREKMTSMIIYYLLDDELISEFNNFPIPVDLHVMRVSIANEMILFPDAAPTDNLFNKTTTAALRNLYVDYAHRKNVNPIDLCNAVWLYSEALCGYQPGNITLEPQGRDARNGRGTHLVPLEYKPLDDAQRAAYARTCGRCALRETCEWNIPGKPYYVQGELVRRGKRWDYDLPEPLFDWS